MKRGNALLIALTLLLTIALVVPQGELVAVAESGAATETAQSEVAEAAEAVEEEITWRDGMSPSKPYAGVPEVDLSKQLGYMIFFPSKTRATQSSCQKLFIYLPRTDVKVGKGTFYLASEEDGELWRTGMDNEAAVRQRELTTAEKKSLMWGEGACFEITLPKSLELGKTYFVNMERGCIETTDGKLSNPAVGGTDMWRFTIEGDYGVSNMEYRRALGTASESPEVAVSTDSETGETITPEVEYETGILHPLPGDNIRFDLTLGGDAAMAVLYCYFSSVDFPMTYFEESCEVTGSVLTESPFWGIMFLDDHGNELKRVEFR